MTITLLSGEMLSPDLKRRQLFDLVWWYGPLAAPTRSLGAVFRREPASNPMQLALEEFKKLVVEFAPEANYVLCTRLERTLVTTETGSSWNLMITGTPALVTSIEED